MNKIFFTLVIGLFLLTSCRHKNDSRSTTRYADTIMVPKTIKDTVFVESPNIDRFYRDTDTVFVVEIPAVMLGPSQLDSAHTQRVMEESLWKNYIDIPIDFKKNYRTELYINSDLSQLPYLLLSMSHPNSINNGILVDNFISLCAGAIDDSALFELGKRTTDRLNELRSKRPPTIVKKKDGREYHMTPILYEYPDSFIPSFVSDFSISKPYSLNHIDTLRVRAIAYNDRKALGKIERYYNEKNDAKGIAIYYKVLLSYEGNGDLAEKYYYVLRPYLAEQPEFLNSIREVLLRAALCDHNARAQELCDSLGFSLCDYRLPLPE